MNKSLVKLKDQRDKLEGLAIHKDLEPHISRHLKEIIKDITLSIEGMENKELGSNGCIEVDLFTGDDYAIVYKNKIEVYSHGETVSLVPSDLEDLQHHYQQLIKS